MEYEEYWASYIKDLLETCSPMMDFDDLAPGDIEEILDRLHKNDSFWAMIDEAIYSTIEDMKEEKNG